MKRTLISLVLLFCAGKALAQFGENKIAYDQFEWKTYRSTHFTVYFYERERSSLQKVTSYAESAYDDISRALNFQILKAINLIYYGTHSDFEQTNTLLNFIPVGVGAFSLPSRNRMVLPIDLPDEKLQQLIGPPLNSDLIAAQSNLASAQANSQSAHAKLDDVLTNYPAQLATAQSAVLAVTHGYLDIAVNGVQLLTADNRLAKAPRTRCAIRVI